MKRRLVKLSSQSKIRSKPRATLAVLRSRRSFGIDNGGGINVKSIAGVLRRNPFRAPNVQLKCGGR